MSACTFELRCDFVAAKQRLEECALSGDYKGTVLYDKFPSLTVKENKTPL